MRLFLFSDLYLRMPQPKIPPIAPAMAPNRACDPAAMSKS